MCVRCVCVCVSANVLYTEGNRVVKWIIRSEHSIVYKKKTIYEIESFASDSGRVT